MKTKSQQARLRVVESMLKRAREDVEKYTAEKAEIERDEPQVIKAAKKLCAEINEHEDEVNSAVLYAKDELQKCLMHPEETEEAITADKAVNYLLGEFATDGTLNAIEHTRMIDGVWCKLIIKTTEPKEAMPPVKSVMPEIDGPRLQALIEQAQASGFIVDTHCNPPLAYKGPRFSPTEARSLESFQPDAEPGGYADWINSLWRQVFKVSGTRSRADKVIDWVKENPHPLPAEPVKLEQFKFNGKPGRPALMLVYVECVDEPRKKSYIVKRRNGIDIMSNVYAEDLFHYPATYAEDTQGLNIKPPAVLLDKRTGEEVLHIKPGEEYHVLKQGDSPPLPDEFVLLACRVVSLARDGVLLKIRNKFRNSVTVPVPLGDIVAKVTSK